MPEHRQVEGREVIDWLAAFGVALGYTPELEWRVPDPAGPTYIDVAWLRRPSDAAPLFVFEVESVPGSQMAENAAKVLSVPTTAMPKPVFFFHLVLKGSGGRPTRAARTHDSANYGVYLLAKDGESNRLIRDVFAHHERIASAANSDAVMASLQATSLPGCSKLDAIGDASESGLGGHWTRTAAVLARGSPEFEPLLATLLLPELTGDRPHGAQYETWWGYYWSTPIHLGVLAALDPSLGTGCFSALRSWQDDPGFGPPKQIGPYFGLRAEFDDFIVQDAPYLWAVLASVLRHVNGAPRWIAEQLAMTLDKNSLRPGALAPSVAWLLHIASAFGLGDLDDRCRQRISGLPCELVLRPGPFAIAADDMGSWMDWVEASADPLPSAGEIKAAVVTARISPPRPVVPALDLLLGLEGPGPDSEREVAALLHLGA
jgi:hypothetical protein